MHWFKILLIIMLAVDIGSSIVSIGEQRKSIITIWALATLIVNGLVIVGLLVYWK